MVDREGFMRRRTLIQSALAVAATLPIRGLRVRAQALGFPGAQEDVLRELAATVLPSALGRAGTDRIAADFAAWVRDYRVGAEMSPGYGSPRLRYKGPSPAPLYQRQLEALSANALASPDLAVRRKRLAAEMENDGVRNIPGIPQGEHVVADLMSFWFSSPAAQDQAYRAAIGRDQCRSLATSGTAPRPLEGG
jgi:hypothetical protein